MNELDRRRFGRQICLAEVGERGQNELCRAEVTVAASAHADVERAYLAAAGVRVAVGATSPGVTAEEVARVLDALSLETEEARVLAEGALRALTALRAILDVG